MRSEAGGATEATYELVISVDARRSGAYDDSGKTRMREQLYRVLEGAFTQARVPMSAVHLEDRGDGVLAAVAGRVPPTLLLGLWVVEVHEQLRAENGALRIPLGLRIGMHVGPVRHDAKGISGRAVDHACRLADSDTVRQALDAAAGADLIVVVSESLYEDVVRSGGKFVEPEQYTEARLRVKEGEARAWYLLPGRPRTGPAPAPARPGTAHRPPDRLAGGGQPPGEVQVMVHGDMSTHSGNLYQAPVHIGRKGGDGRA